MNNMAPFHKTSPSKHSRTSQQIRTLTRYVHSAKQLTVAFQSREGDMDEFFSNENQGSPPSLSDMGELRQCTKSDLIGCFDKLATSTASVCGPPEVDAKILDGSVIVNMLLPKSCSTFGDYAENVFLPYVLRNLQNTKRLDVI